MIQGRREDVREIIDITGILDRNRVVVEGERICLYRIEYRLGSNRVPFRLGNMSASSFRSQRSRQSSKASISPQAAKSPKSTKRKRTRQGEDAPRIRRLGSIVNQLMARRGYAQVNANEAMLASLVSEVGPEIGNDCSVGKLRSGVLHVFVTNSVTLQELNFRKRGILKRLQAETPGETIKDIRFRIQS